MKLHHIAIWTFRLEELKEFYVRFLGGKSNEKYVNPKKGFESYFISFGEGPSLELMSRPDVQNTVVEENRVPARRKFFVSLRKCVPKVTPLPVSRALRETAILKVSSLTRTGTV